MKKMLLVLGISTVFSVAATAQHFQLGIKGGVNVSNFSGSSNIPDVKEKALVGFHAGAFINLGLGKNFSIQPEVLLSTQGATLETPTGDEKFKVTYVNVPVMAKYRFDGGFYLEAGPQIGFKVDDKTGDEDLEDFYNGSDLSIAAGLGYHSAMGLGIGARYTAGLSKVSDYDFSTTKPDYKNSVIQVSVFYTLFNKRD